MPYERDEDLPEAVKKLPPRARHKWRVVFNAALKEYGDEERAFATAWAAVKDEKGEKAVQVRLYGAFTKVDDEARIVGGIITSEAVDTQGDVVDFAATKDAVADWAKWGNIREMHQPKAAGTATHIEVDDAAKRVYVEAKIVDDDAWRKVKEGVYKGFSIGGRVLESVLEKSGIRRIVKYLLTEVSLVDRPANPEAVFTVIKRDDAGEASVEKAVWSTAYINDLPDSSFAYIEPGGEKDEEGKTVPRSKRHLPYKDKDGKPDPAHVRNALARLPQTDIPEEAKAEARRKLIAAAKELGIEVSEDKEKENLSADLVKAGSDSMQAMMQRMHEMMAEMKSMMERMLEHESEHEGDKEDKESDEQQKAAGAPAPVFDADALQKAVDDRVQGLRLAKAEELAKVTAEVDRLRAKLAEAAETIGRLEARVKALEDAPAPGGPVLKGVAAGIMAPDAELQALQKLARETKDPLVRDALGREIALRQTRMMMAR